MSAPPPPTLDALFDALETEVARLAAQGPGLTPQHATRLQRLARTVAERAPRVRTGGAGEPPNGLPEDFLQALEADGGQYRGKPLPDVIELDLQPPGIVSLKSGRNPEADWVGGSLLGFKDEETCVFHGEILHVDPDDARLFAQATRELVTEEDVLAAERWVFRPFDFSQVVRDAAGAYSARGPRLAEALEGVEGAPPPAIASGAPATVDKVPSEAWAQSWGYLWGPPGTGKTEAAARLMADALLKNPRLRLLAVAPTNRAADTLALRVARMLEREGALEHGGLCRIYRGGLGVGAEVTGAFPRLVLDPDLADHAAARAQTEERLRLAEQQGAAGDELAQVRAEAVTARRELKDPTPRLVKGGQVGLVVLTVHRALKLVSELAGEEHFDKLVVDEAGMVSRAAAALLVPLAKTVLWAGDPLQLGPISQAGGHGAEGVQSGVRRWLRASPMTHLTDASRDALRPDVVLLRAQHRMHPEISRVVSHFAYDGMLEDAEGPRTRVPRKVPAPFPDARAAWVVLDRSLGDGPHVHAERGPRGRGYVRPASAELALALATPAVEAGLSVLAIAPYRAHAEWLQREASARKLPLTVFASSTVHRQQGTEFDVVLVDTVNAGRPFHASELTAMLNVAASRAREYLFVLASRAESHAQVPWRLLGKLQPLLVDAKGAAGLRAAAIELPSRRTPPVRRAPQTLSEDVAGQRTARPLPTQEQVSLVSRRFDEGHHVVRGVAGSGKTWVLVAWAARHLVERRQSRILITFFNRSLASLVTTLLRESLASRVGAQEVDAHVARARIQHVDSLRNERFNAVFVDEAQDLEAAQLAQLHDAVEPVEVDGRQQRALYLFLDDSQNIYGRSALEDIREKLPEELSFSGRVRVLRESFRSPQQVLDLAFNVVLDPLRVHGVPSPGMREFIRTRDLVGHGLLEEPSAQQPLFRVGYTERQGTVPVVRGFSAPEDEEAWLVAEVQRLLAEGVAPADLLVVALQGTPRWAQALNRGGVRAVAYGGKQGQRVEVFPPLGADHVRVTTIMSAKGHESPVVFLVGLEALDDIDWLMKSRPRNDARETERTRRSLFYVGSTRATLRQYLSGLAQGRFVRVCADYAGRIEGTAVTDVA